MCVCLVSRTYIFVCVLLVAIFDAFVEQWIQADQKQHVHHQQRYHPNHNDHHHLYDGRITILIFAFASWTKSCQKVLLFADIFANAHILLSQIRQNHIIAIAKWNEEQVR